MYTELTAMRRDRTARRGDKVAQSTLGLDARLSPDDDELSRRAELAAERARLLGLSLRDLEKLSGLGRNQVADTLNGIPSNVQHLLFVEEGLRKHAGKVLVVITPILTGDKRRIA